MPWCPNCKNEYRKGITVCADCGALLVDSLIGQSLVRLLLVDQAEAAEKLVEFLRFEGISEVESRVLSEQEGKSASAKEADTMQIELLVPEGEKKEASQLAQAFFTVEQEKKLKALSPEELEVLKQQEEEAAEQARNVHTYVNAQEKYQENRSAAWMFLGFGAVGLIVTILNMVGVLSIVSGWFSLGISCGLFLIFLGIGFSSLKRSKTLQGEIATENAKTEEILDWLKEYATPERLADADDPEAGAEENDLNRFNLVKELISTQFPGLDENYIDHLSDRFLGD